MKTKKLLTFLLLFSVITFSSAQNKKFNIHTVAFYNFENLFDTIKSPNTFDEEYTPTKGWTSNKYKKKIDNLARVISEIGTDENPSNSPVVIGACEIENRDVLEDLVKHPKIVEKGYKIVHFDSPDKRGIDVALLYQEKYFTPTSYLNIPLYIYDNQGKKSKKENEEKEDDFQIDQKTKRIYTRDQLLVTGLLDGEEVSFIVNHWPSRSGGEKKSSPNREAAGKLNKKIIDSLYSLNPEAKIITMGDLNDDPINKSVKKGIGTIGKREDLKPFDMYNPMEKMYQQGIGTLGYRDAWNLFDQMIISEPLTRKDYSSWRYWKAQVFKKPYLVQNEGQWKGYPKRNSNGEAGFSDHFPVYIYLIKEVK